MRTLPLALRLALRWNRKNATSMVPAVAALALAIGLNLVIFNVADWLLLRPLPIQQPNRVVQVVAFPRDGEMQGALSGHEFQGVRDAGDSIFAAVTADSNLHESGLTYQGATVPLNTDWVGANFFSLLGLKPARGRFFSAARSAPAVVLSYDFWAHALHADPAVVGSSVLVGGEPTTVIGVAPRGFHGLSDIEETQAYLPIEPPAVAAGDLVVLGRLRSSLSPSQATAALTVLSAQLGPKSVRLGVVHIPPFGPNPGSRGTAVFALSVLQALGLLLFLVCVLTAAHLVVGLAHARRGEIAVCVALGANAWWLACELLAQALVVGAAALAGGVAIAVALDRLIALVPLHLAVPVLVGLAVTWRVAALGVLVSIFAVAALTFAPLRSLLRGSDPARSLASAGRLAGPAQSRLSLAFGAAQVAGSVLLLVFAALFATAAWRAENAPLGFDPTDVINITIAPGLTGSSPAAGERDYRAAIKRVRFIPGVQSASLAAWVPMSGDEIGTMLKVPAYRPPPGAPGAFAYPDPVSGGYFRTMHIPILMGSPFAAGWTAGLAHPALVNASMARKYWPGVSPIGRVFWAGSKQLTVVGVVGNTPTTGVSLQMKPHIFYPKLATYYSPRAVLQVRTTAGAAPTAAILTALRSASRIPATRVETMDQVLDGPNGFLLARFATGLTTFLAAFAVLMAAMAVFSIVARACTARRREAGIRLALGSGPLRLRLRLARWALGAVVAGVVVGLAAAYPAALALAPLYGSESPTDLRVYGVTCLLMLAPTLFASLAASRRIVRTPASELLREL